MSTKPNILFLMCDQMQGRVLQDKQCITPNLDKLASSGIRFANAYTPNAVCSPARASLMTGLLPHNHGVMWVTHLIDSDQGSLREDKPHWAQILERSGYSTGYFGKWHVERTNDLQSFGWQRAVTDSCPEFKELYRKGKNVAGEPLLAGYNNNPEGYNKDLVLYAVTNLEPEKRMAGISTGFALKYLDEVLEKDDPWCCFVSVIEPHDPFICGKKAFEKYDVDALELPPNIHDELENRPNLYKKAGRTWKDMTDRQKKEAKACYFASITEVDEQFGKLIDRVRAAGKLENTIVILTSDHGEMLGAHGMYCKNIGGFEEIYNIPLIFSGPGISKGQVSNARVGLHDVGQTLLELTGNDTFNTADSRSFASVLADPCREINFQTGFAQYHGGRILLTQRIVWDGAWKYIFNGFDYDELYNLEHDPYELDNLACKPEYDGILRKMSGQMWGILEETGDTSLYNSDYPALRLATYGPGVEK